MKKTDKISELPTAGFDEKRADLDYPNFLHRTYFSSTAGRETGVNILLPPGYTKDKKYPVLYMLHGFYGNEYSLCSPEMRLSIIYNNLLADGDVKEMVIVLPYIFCDRDMPVCTGMDLDNCFAYDNFINDLTTDLFDFIEHDFSVLKGRENTAITGFSMGGRESIFIGIKHPELFGFVGAACPAPGLVNIPGSALHPGQITPDEMRFESLSPQMLMISSSKADDVVGDAPDSYRKILSENGVSFVSHVLDKAGHNHTSVKPHLYYFLRELFK